MSLLINVTIPVFNEQTCLAKNVRQVVAFLDGRYGGRYELVIADNASTDQTFQIALELERTYTCIRVVHLDLKGRGRALRTSWMKSRADILSYMDVDLSTDLSFFPRLIEPLASGTADLCVGSRLLEPSYTTRGLKREVLSRCYNSLVRTLFRAGFSDAQCGFKALTRRSANELLPLVVDKSWFFDTELLLLAERLGHRIYDLPVRWRDDLDSRVKIFRTARDDIWGLLRLRLAFIKEDIAARIGSKRAERCETRSETIKCRNERS